MKKIIIKVIIPLIILFTFCLLLNYSLQEVYSVFIEKFPPFTRILEFIKKITPIIVIGVFLISSYLVIFQDKFGLKVKDCLIGIRIRLGKTKWLLMGFILFIPFILFYTTRIGALVVGLPSRLVILIIFGVTLAYLITKDRDKLVNAPNLCISYFVFSILFSLGGLFLKVNNYPFTLDWSEGNRFWDYSTLFGHELYNFRADEPIFAFIDKGRQILWGLPFLLGRITIWQMRLWDVFLFSIPYMIFGWIVFQRFPDNKRLWFLAGLWTFLFFRTGPIYTPIVLCAILVALAWRRPWWIAFPLIAFAGYYAQLTRFTWMFAPAMWAGMLYISDYYEENPKLLYKPVPMAIGAVLAGLFGSIGIEQIVELMNSTNIQQSKNFLSGTSELIGLDQAASVVSTQALLWERLFPSTTNETGILLMLALITGPVLIYLGYLIGKKYWKLNLLSKITLAACLTIFAIVGIIISVKIGGGNNLHNMDMFLISIVFCAALAWRQRIDLRILNLSKEPTWIQGIWIAMMFIFSFSTLYTSRPLELAPGYFVDEVLRRVNKEINLANQKGEILFIDHRQILTFGYVEQIPLVDEYEKKYLMDQAFTSNEQYLEQFREDIRNQRFSLIITEPLQRKLGEDKLKDTGFVEENDAWVMNVSRPVLCYYEQIVVYPNVRLLMLVPKQNPPPCKWDPDNR